jgi:hypothetical protein
MPQFVRPRAVSNPIGLITPLLSDPPDLSVLEDKSSWTIIRENAGRYGVGALVAHSARSHVSPQERTWCDTVLVAGWGRHERMLQQLDYLTGLFDSEGIRTIALKGPLLAQRYYKPAFLRKSSIDLDIAVIADDLENACKVLLRVGYRQEMPLNEALARSHHVQFLHPSRPTVELHFRLSHMSLGIPVNQFFDRAVACRLPSGREALVLGPADQLLHLVLHLATSRFGTLFHLYEIRRVCAAEPLSVRAEAIARAVDHGYCGVLRMLDVAFRSRWGEPFIPPDTALPVTWLNWRLNEELYDAFDRWATPGQPLTLRARLQGRWLDFQVTDAPSDAIRSIVLWLQTARFQMKRRAWGTLKPISYVPAQSPLSSRDKDAR